MKTIYFISFACLSYFYGNAQTTTPDSPKVLPDTATSIDQNKSGALYRSPNDSLKRPSAAHRHEDSTHVGKAEIKDSLYKEPKTVKYKRQSVHVKNPANKKVKTNTRQNASTNKKIETQ